MGRRRRRRRRLKRHFRAETSLGAGVCVCAGIGDVLKLIKGHGWARHGTPRRVNNGQREGREAKRSRAGLG